MRWKTLIGISFIAITLFITGNQSAWGASFVFNRNLSYGSTGQDVKELQKFLNTNGFSLAALGYGSKGNETTFFGPRTLASLIRFQIKNGIVPARGFFGPITRGFINRLLAQKTSVVPPTPVAPPETDTETYYSIGGSITGISGEITLQNNGGDDLVIKPGDSSEFIFPTKLKNGAVYAVTVKPDNLAHKCYLEGASGVIQGATVQTVKIACGVSLFFNPFTYRPGAGGTTGTSSATQSFSCGEDLIDPRDGQSYATVSIGAQCWMAENMNIGTQINGVNNQADADSDIIEKYCYDDNAAICGTDGALYQWHTAMAYEQQCDNHLNTDPCIASSPRRGICAEGWHLPTFAELQTLAQVSDPGCDLNCDSGFCSCVSAGGKMKAEPGHLPVGWDGTDIYDFSLIPSGRRNPDGSFDRYGISTNLWSSTMNNSLSWFTSFFGVGNPFAIDPNGMYGGLNSREYGYSVRCIKD